MEKSVHTPLYDVVKAKLVALRRAARLSQRQLAAKLRTEPASIARIELGERRLDIIEFLRICQACGVDPEKVAGQLMHDLMEFDKANKRKSPKDSRTRDARS